MQPVPGCAVTCSPHARGCSHKAVDRHKLDGLFPACAGVILNKVILIGRLVAFPRMRGGDPNRLQFRRNGRNFSPHARG